MAINVHNSKWLLLALVSLAVVSGCCCQAVPLPGENQCPTDARRLYCTCGEEAVRRGPLGPDREFYGLKPTCWREWPEGWQCNGCEGFPYVDHESCGEPVADAPMAQAPMAEPPVSADGDFANPFRSKSGAAELPLPPQARDITPTQSAPAKAAPVQLIPPQPTPTAPPALEMVPQEAAPAKAAPTESPAPTTKPAIEKPAEKATSFEVEPSKTAAAAPHIAPTTQVEEKAPLPMPIAPAAVKISAAPILMPPQNAVPQTSASNPDQKPAQVVAEPKAEKKQAAKATVVPTARKREEDPAMSNRVEQHLLNNLRL